MSDTLVFGQLLRSVGAETYYHDDGTFGIILHYVYCRYLVAMGLQTYGCVYLSGWNLHFPTPVEQLLWRVITVCTMSAICFYWPMDLYAFYLHNHVKSRLRSWTGTRDKGTEAAPVLEKLVKKRHRNL